MTDDVDSLLECSACMVVIDRKMVHMIPLAMICFIL